jgi:hypothetical protein
MAAAGTWRVRVNLFCSLPHLNVSISKSPILSQALLNSFYYVGALNETVGYSNRITRFLEKATQSKDSSGADALLLTSESTGQAALAKRSVRSWSARAEQPSQMQQLSLVAVFSHVTVKNPANITLIQDLNMQVPVRSVPAPPLLVMRRLMLSIVVLRYPVARAAS